MSAIYKTSYYPESSSLDVKMDNLFDRVIGLLASASNASFDPVSCEMSTATSQKAGNEQLKPLFLL